MGFGDLYTSNRYAKDTPELSYNEIIEIMSEMLNKGEITEELFTQYKNDLLGAPISIEDEIAERAWNYVKRTRSQLKQLSMDELVWHKKCERAHLLLFKDKIKHVKARKVIHPFKLVALNGYHAWQNIHVKVLGKVPKTKRPIIFAVSHIGMYDVEIVLQAIKKHAYIFSGDEEAMYRTFDGGFFDANGCYYVDPDDPVDSAIAPQNLVQYSKNGIYYLWYPEGTWNLTEAYVIMPMHAKIIDVADNVNGIILPVGVDQRDKENGIDFIVNIGEVFDPKEMYTGSLTKEKKIELAEELRSDMARLKYDIYEPMSRADIDDGYYQRFLDKRIAEWPFYNLDIIRSRMFNPNHNIYEKDVFAHLNEIEIGSNNAFLARTRKQFNDYHKRDLL
ncbi:MAG: 1-acyl-sn-glycerol-3-phosphate acyltransferase [Bacilli bacterium]|nr:1-acyl-sn-glycerol-3-phosphate acyltransferase [Bacilli bacterium]